MSAADETLLVLPRSWLRPVFGLAAVGLIGACTNTPQSPSQPAQHVAKPSSSPTRTSAEFSGPPWFAVLERGAVHWFNSRGATPIGMSASPAGMTVTALASLHDGRSIFMAARPATGHKCSSVLIRQSVQTATRLADFNVPYVGRLSGVPDVLAVSADRSKLAMALRVPEHPAGACEYLKLVVVDLHNGHRRSWTLPDSTADAGYGDYFISPLAWSPDNRHLALHVGQCCADGAGIWTLDTAGRPGRLLASLHRLPNSDACVGMPYAWTAQGHHQRRPAR